MADCKKYDVMGIGAALMDFIVEVDDGKLVEMDLRKGEMHLISEEKSGRILSGIQKSSFSVSPGGSAANTAAGVAALGGSSVFCGKVGKDLHGDAYEQKSAECGVCTRIGRHPFNMTGHAITFITPDRERTFATHLGAAVHIGKEDIIEDDIAKSRIVHIEGYQLEDKSLREIALNAMASAKKHRTLVSIDLADPGLVRRNLADIRMIVKENADIVFANEKEAEEFSGMKDENAALDFISGMCGTAAVKLGARGSLIKKDGRTFRIEAVKTKAVDTTGAGDMYAAGFLFGIAKGFSIERCGRIGSWAAAKVVGKIGARLGCSLKDEVKTII